MTIKDDEYIDLPTPSGTMRTHLFRPADHHRHPGVVFYSEIFQVTGPVRRMAAVLAGHRYVVAVPEIYHEFEAPGTVLRYDPAGTERGNQLKVTKPLANFDSDAQAVLGWLQRSEHCNGRFGAVGICIGGHLAFRAAFNGEVLAAACFYPTDLHEHSLGEGRHDDSLARAPEIKGELMMIFGRQDPHVPREGRLAIHQALAGADLNFTWHEFNAAHAFMRDEGARYDPSLARLCYGLLFDLFNRRLR